MEFEVPKRHILRLSTSSTNMVRQVLQWKMQKRCYGRKEHGPMTKKLCYSDFFMNCFWRIGDEDMRREGNGQTWF